MSKYELTDVIADLLGKPVREAGVNAMVQCPLPNHNDRHASLSIHLNTGVWLCHACGARGGLEQFARILGGEISADILADRAVRSVSELPPARHDFRRKATAFAHSLRNPMAQEALQAYCKAKGIIVDVLVSHFKVGWTGRALSFPYYDDGSVPMLKYRFPDGSKAAEPGSVRTIYNIDDVRGAGSVILLEGESDTAVAYSRTLNNSKGVKVCGVPGATISESTWENWALDLMFAQRIAIAFDADEAGDKGAEVAMRVLGEDRCQRFRPTRGKDLSLHFMAGGTFMELAGEKT